MKIEESLLSVLVEIDQKINTIGMSLTERNKNLWRHLLTEVTQWGIRTIDQSPLSYIFIPETSPEEETSFSVQLVQSMENPGYWQLKFGNLKAGTDKEKYTWDKKDPQRLRKALFLRNVLEQKVKGMLENGDIGLLYFTPYLDDGLGDERRYFFNNLFDKLKPQGARMWGEENTYFIEGKPLPQR